METCHHITVSSVELYEAETEVFDIEVDADHSFIVGGGVVVHNSTLDNRTSQQCLALNGLSWKLPDFEPIDHKIEWPGYPPRHFNCRSTTTAVFKSFKELSADKAVTTEAGGRSDMQTLYEQNLRESGMSEDKIKQAVFEAKASMDGQVPREQNFGNWLSNKPVAFQDELLGKGKAQMWRDGKISLSQLVDQQSRPLTLAELKSKYG